MKIRKWSIKDVDLINEWLIARDMAPVDPEELPQRGWVVVDEKKPVGAVFIRLCEGAYGIMEALINDPTQTAEKRNLINDRLFARVRTYALQNELKGVFGTTLDKGTRERATRHNFYLSPMALCIWRNEKVM